MTTQRIMDDPGISEHDDAAMFFNQLLLDLKKQLLNHAHELITMERLNEGSKHIADLMKCCKPSRYY